MRSAASSGPSAIRPPLPVLAVFGLATALSCSPAAPATDAPIDAPTDADRVLPDGDADLDAIDVVVDVDDTGTDCLYCGTPCEGAEPACGDLCCYGVLSYPAPWEPHELLCDYWCGIRVVFAGLLVLDYDMYPELRGNPGLIRLSEYDYRGNRTELVVVGLFGDDWQREGCLDHCWESDDYVWVVDISTRNVIYADRFDYLGQAMGDFTNMVDGLPPTDCRSPIAGEDDVGVSCTARADVPALDETFYVGWSETHRVYSWFDPGGPDYRADLPWLTDAIHLFRISTGEWLGTAALRLVDPGAWVWHADPGP